ncbi:periplasmic divalent cation tolerance protein [Nitrobacteraceae bacterium AZCC 1564]
MIFKGCVVLTTINNKEQAEKLAKAVLEARLAACAQIQAITSYYWWEGKVANDAEYLIHFKTDAAKYDALESTILALHPYDTPEIIQLPIEAGSSKYLAWIQKETG